ncbi:MAG: GFA family protein [Myxococcota bacterium]
MSRVAFPQRGGCPCGDVAYALGEDPLSVYACHCTDCQSATGSAFSLAMIVRRDALRVVRGEPVEHGFATPDGRDKSASVCPRCQTALFAPTRIPDLMLLEAGTLDDTSWVAPVAHIWTRSAQPWLLIPPDALRFAEQPDEEGTLAMVRAWKERHAPAARADVIGIDHLYLAVRDVAASERFYDRAMPLLGFRKGESIIAGERHVHYYGRPFGFTLRPARPDTPDHDPYAPGLHHVSFRVLDEASVDRVAGELRALGIDATPPQTYPEYAPDYYATFFEDPDGIRLEVCNFWEKRRRRMFDWEGEEMAEGSRYR